MDLTSDEIGGAIAVGITVLVVVLALSHFDRPRPAGRVRVRSAVSWGALFAASNLLAGVLEVPPFLEPPYPTIVVTAICVIAIGGSMLFFAAMLRDGSTED